MKTLIPFKQSILKFVLFVLLSASAIISNARTSTGMQSDNGSIQPGSAGINNHTSSFSTPVNKLAAFTVMLTNTKRVDLKWTTEIETNLSHIMVEKSSDGKNYRDAALVFTYGNTTSRSDYTFSDNIINIKLGPVYYRLRIVDADGTTQYSDTRIIEISK